MRPAPILIVLLAAAVLVPPAPAVAAEAADPSKVQFRWGERVPLRDGVELAATLYRPREQSAPLPCIFTLTPYIAASYHERGVYFAAHGYVFASIDVRGRGNSGGEFTPLLQEARDGHDVVQWLAAQPYCNGRVTMWGGSYAGYNQWATAKEFPPALATIVPVASPKPGIDFPMRNNIFYGYDMTWLTLVSGRAAQDAVFGDAAFWRAQFGHWFDSGRPFAELDEAVGNPSPIFQQWIAHPMVDAYWDGYSPTADQMARLDLPILSITGHYDGDQPGALALYRDHMQHGNEAARRRHFLIIGPWDHAGTRTPRAAVGGLTFGEASLLDLNGLHKAWYDWTLKDGERPAFLRDQVAFYVVGEEAWRYAPSLDAVTASHRRLFLDSSDGRASEVFGGGRLADSGPGRGAPDAYVHDPLDAGPRWLEAQEPAPGHLVDQRGDLAVDGRQLVYHGAPFAQDTDLAGFFRLTAYLELDQPDTDLQVAVHEVKVDGSTVLLTRDMMRARHRDGVRTQRLVEPGAVEAYRFEGFAFTARRIARGSRLRLVLGPATSIHLQRNFNAGGRVAHESAADARTVRVRLHHSRRHPSVLEVPIAATSSVPADP